MEVLARLLWAALNFSATLESIDRENYIVINRDIIFHFQFDRKQAFSRQRENYPLIVI